MQAAAALHGLINVTVGTNWQVNAFGQSFVSPLSPSAGGVGDTALAYLKAVGTLAVGAGVGSGAGTVAGWVTGNLVGAGIGALATPFLGPEAAPVIAAATEAYAVLGAQGGGFGGAIQGAIKAFNMPVGGSLGQLAADSAIGGVMTGVVSGLTAPIAQLVGPLFGSLTGGTPTLALAGEGFAAVGAASSYVSSAYSHLVNEVIGTLSGLYFSQGQGGGGARQISRFRTITGFRTTIRRMTSRTTPWSNRPAWILRRTHETSST